jgi:crescentin
MATPWVMIAKALGGAASEAEASRKAETPRTVAATPTPPPPPVPPAPQPAPMPAEPERWTLDAVGQQTENVRERVDQMMGRLEELKSLADDFDQIVQPINTFVQQHTQARSKLAELQMLLARETDAGRAVRSELNNLQEAHAKVSDDLAMALASLQKHESLLHDQDALIADLRLRVDDKTASLQNLEQVLAAETERARALAAENHARRNEIEMLEQARSRLDRELLEALDGVGRLESENTRLQNVADGFAQRFASLKGQLSEMEPQLQAGRQEISTLQAKLLVEQTARQKAEASREAERSAQGMEIASLQMKVEGLTAHVETTDRILAHTRDQLRDKAEALRLAEKAIKDNEIERATLDRRVETGVEAMARHTTQLQDMQKANAELQSRSDMLVKAVAAKDAIVDGANRKAAALSSRLELLTARIEQERASFEATNKRLIEELQAEKAERSLAQGALDIARKSRTKLLAQYSTLKRRQSDGSSVSGDEILVEDDHHFRPDFSNVHAFKGGDRTND